MPNLYQRNLPKNCIDVKDVIDTNNIRVCSNKLNFLVLLESAVLFVVYFMLQSAVQAM